MCTLDCVYNRSLCCVLPFTLQPELPGTVLGPLPCVATLCVLETHQRLSMETGGKGEQASAERTPVADGGAQSSCRVLTQEEMAGNRRVRAVLLQ